MCAVEDEEGRVLLLDRKKEDWPGFTLPGGHIEKDETLEESVIREVYEETGLKIKGVELKGVMEWPWEGEARYLAFLYLAKNWEETLKSSEEGECIFIKKEEISHLLLSQDMDQILKIIYPEMKL